MRTTREHMQLLEHLATQRVLREHALDRELDGALGVLVEQLFQAGALQVTHGSRCGDDRTCRSACRPVTRDLAGVDDDDVIASVAVRRVSRLVLAAQTRVAPCEARRPRVLPVASTKYQSRRTVCALAKTVLIEISGKTGSGLLPASQGAKRAGKSKGPLRSFANALHGFEPYGD